MNAAPLYLAEPVETGHVYGTLRFDPRSRSWLIEGEPAVAEMAKRLFPGSSSVGAGMARFPANKRSTADLNWLMLRFPLRVIDRELWERERAVAVQHALTRQGISERPSRVVPPASFVGELRPFQQEGLAFLLHNERALLADEMGLGKTPQALAWLASLAAWPALIVVMPHLVRQWLREINRFICLEAPGQQSLFNLGKAVHVIRGLRPYALPPASIYVTHYLLLRGWKDALPEVGFKAVVFDEIQELRHNKTEKYSAASLLAGSVSHVAGLSGTPIYNHGGEIWNVLNIVEYHCLGDWDSFTREWCYGYGQDIVKNPGLLGGYLRREGLVLRRTKEMVLDELPPKRRVVQEIESDSGLYASLIRPAMDLAWQLGDVKDPLDRGRITREIEKISRRATGVAKARHVCAFVRALLEAGESVILFAYHHDVWSIYKEELNEFAPVAVTGLESGAQKERSVKAFSQGQARLILVSLRAAAGLDKLQERGRCVVFGELDWSPAIHSQAEDRAHRMGQRDSVLSYYLVSDDGMDHDMIEALGLKVQQFVGIMGDRAETEEDRLVAQQVVSQHMQSVIEKLKARRPAACKAG